ncbi:hypothetical protein BASA81_007536 [Batrachochytrium salamandrivorans]|nr:hypothetical protein BASA81_007536 [Batrachochytrium salamandrivorans]
MLVWRRSVRWYVASTQPSPKELRALKELQEMVLFSRSTPPSSSSSSSVDVLDSISRELKSQDLAKMYSPHSLSKILSNLGKADYNDPILLDKFSLLLLTDSALAERYSLHDVSLICSGFSALGVQDYVLFSKLSRVIRRQIAHKPQGFEGSDLVRIAIAFTQLRFGDPELFECLRGAVLSKNINRYIPTELAHLVRTFATMGFKFPDLFQQISKQLCGNGVDLKQFSSKDLVMILQAFARFGKSNEVLFDKLLREMSCRNMAEYDNKHIKVILWSLETLNFAHLDLFHKLWKEYDRRSPHDPYEF